MDGHRGRDRTVRLSTGIATTSWEQGERGNGPPVVLLHAWGESRRVFVRLVPHLTDALWVLAPDLRGHGEADQPVAGYDLATLADDVVAFLDAVGAEAGFLVGASSGGYVAQQVAVARPDRVAGLVLSGAPRSLHGRVAPFADEVDRLVDPIEPAWLREFTLGFVPPGAVPDWYVDLLVEEGLRIPAEVWRLSLEGLGSSPAPTDVGRVSAPTLIVAGADDTVLGREESDALLRAIPGARLVRYPRAGHVVHWEQPERLARDIAAFVGEQPRGRPTP